MTDDNVPESPAEEADLTRTAREAQAKLDSVQAPKQVITKIRRQGAKAPANLRPDPVFEIGVHLRNISIGKAISNTTATLNFDIDVPSGAWIDLIGEHAYAAMLGKSFLGEGLLIKGVPLTIDSENRTVQKASAQITRFASDGKTDQIATCLLPLLGDKAQLIGILDAFDGPWRLNCPVDIEGALRLYQMQETFDLTSTTRPEAEREAVKA